MSIKKELLHQELGKYILDSIIETPPDYEKMINQNAIIVLEEIQKLFLSQEEENDDFLLVDQIISIFHRHGLSTGSCHDF